MSKIDVKANRHARKYSSKEMFVRCLWMVGSVVFRMTPRPFFGLRRNLLTVFGASVAANVHIYPSARIYFPWNLTIGKDSSIGEEARIYNLGKIVIGNRVTISQHAHLCGGSHDFRDPTMPLLKLPIMIGDDAWVCADAFVGPGIIIGRGAVVGARAVVTKDVPDWTIVAGNPARTIRPRTLENDDDLE